MRLVLLLVCASSPRANKRKLDRLPAPVMFAACAAPTSRDTSQAQSSALQSQMPAASEPSGKAQLLPFSYVAALCWLMHLCQSPFRRAIGMSPEGIRSECRRLHSMLDDGDSICGKVPYGVDLLLPQVGGKARKTNKDYTGCLLYTSPSPRDGLLSRMPSSA